MAKCPVHSGSILESDDSCPECGYDYLDGVGGQGPETRECVRCGQRKVVERDFVIDPGICDDCIEEIDREVAEEEERSERLNEEEQEIDMRIITRQEGG